MKADPQRRHTAHLVFLNGAGGSALETLALGAAYCVSYREVFVSGDAQDGSYVCHLVLSDPDGFTMQAGGPATAFVAPPARDHGGPGAVVGAAAIGGAAANSRQKKGSLLAETPAHKADRWARYQQQKAGARDAWSYSRWEKQYDTNMQNVAVGLGTEVKYKEKFGGVSKVLKTALTLRQIDMHREEELYCGQLKTGKISLGKQEKLDVQKDGWLIATLGMEVEYILEKGAAKPLLAALAKIGAKVTIGSQL